MSKLRRNVLAAAAVLVVSVGAFAQGNDNRRPPKNPDHVVEKEKPKREKPQPPSNNNQGKDGDKRGKP